MTIKVALPNHLTGIVAALHEGEKTEGYLRDECGASGDDLIVLRELGYVAVRVTRLVDPDDRRWWLTSAGHGAIL